MNDKTHPSSQQSTTKPSSSKTSSTSVSLHLTEPQSPFLHTKQRAQLKRKHSELVVSKHDPYIDPNFCEFDRDNGMPPKKRFRNSLTEPKPFHFQTEERSVLRAASNVNHKKLSLENYNLPEKTNWVSTLTEPKEFHFATADRAELRSHSSTKENQLSTQHPMSSNDHDDLGIFDSDRSNGDARRKRASSLSRDPNTSLTQPRPFHFQTEQRALHKIEQNGVRNQNPVKPKLQRKTSVLRRNNNTKFRRTKASPKVQAKLRSIKTTTARNRDL